MSGRLLGKLLNATADTDGESDTERQFAGSLLDWSVNDGHDPATNREASREMAQRQAKADLPDEADHRRR